MKQILSYLFWPNPGNTSYADPKITIALLVCALLLIGSYLVKRWRSRNPNPMTRKLSRTWATAMFWFAVTAMIMIVSRVEEIQFLAMRFLWMLWAGAIAAYLFIQMRIYQTRHYTVLPKEAIEDPRDKYLPKRRKH